MFEFIDKISLALHCRHKYCIMVWRPFPENNTMQANLYAKKSALDCTTVTKWLHWLWWSSPRWEETEILCYAFPSEKPYLKRLYKQESVGGKEATLQTKRGWNTAQKYLGTFNSPKKMIWSMKTCPHNLRKYKSICVSSSETWTSS